MAATYSSQRNRQSIWPTMLLIGAVVTIAGAATIGGLWATGKIDIAQWFKEKVTPAVGPPPVPEGMLAMPISSRDIAAYSSVTRDDMWDSQKGQFTYTFMGPEYVYLGITLSPGRSGALQGVPGPDSPAERGGMRDGDELVQVNGQTISNELSLRKVLLDLDVGDSVELTVKRKGEVSALSMTMEQYVLNFADVTSRVLDRDKRRGYVFRAIDMLPELTREGIAAGIPPGKRGLTIEAEKLVGVHGLRIKDRVDLVASIPVQQLAAFDSGQTINNGGSGLAQFASLAPNDTAPRATVGYESRVLTRDAVVVTPVIIRPVPQTDTTVFGTQNRTGKVQQITIAVDEADVPIVAEAVGAEFIIQCLVLSGVPSEVDPQAPPPGMIAVPIAAHAMPANYRVMRGDLLDRRTRQIRYIHMPEKGLAERGIILDPIELFGRVLQYDKPAGEIFLRSDLAPDGTPEGIAGAIPSGLRSFTLSADQLEGAELLRRGDQIDVLATIELNAPKGLQPSYANLLSDELRVVVRSGRVLAPVGAPETRSRVSLASQKQAAQQVILAIKPAEVTLLAQVLSKGAKLTVLLSSESQAKSELQPAEPTDDGKGELPTANAESPLSTEDSIPEYSPLKNLRATDLYLGGKNRTMFFLPSRSDADRFLDSQIPAATPAVTEPATEANAAANHPSHGGSYTVAKPALLEPPR